MAIPGRELTSTELSDLTEPRTASVGLEPRLLSDAASARPSLSPDGSRIAFLADEGGGAQVFVTGTALWGPRRVSRADHPVVTVSWCADGSLLAFATAPAGGARTQLHVVDGDGRSQRPMFVAHGESALPGTWTRTGRGYAFSTTLGCAEEGCSSYVLDLSESTLLPLARASAEDGRIEVDDLTADGRLALLRLGRGLARRTVLLDRSTGRRSALPVADAHARFTADASGIVFRDRRPDGTRLLAGCTTGGGVAGPVAALAYSPTSGTQPSHHHLDAVAFSGDRNLALLVTAQADGSHRLSLWSPAAGTCRPVPLPAGPLTVLTAALDATGRRGVVELSGPDLPPSIWMLDVAAAALTRLDTGASAPDPARAPASRLRFPGAHGATLSGHLFCPSTSGAERPGPTVLLLPGAPDEPDRPYHRPLVTELLNLEIRVFRLTARMAVPDEASPAAPSDACPDDSADALAAARFLVDTGIADGDQLGICGEGYGGFLALRAIAAAPELFSAAVDVGGVANLETFAASVDRADPDPSSNWFGDLGSGIAALKELSPLSALQHTSVPTLVVHGGADSTVPLQESEQVVEALRRTGAEVEALFLPDEGHALTSRAAQQLVVPAVVDWFLRLLTRSRSAGSTLSTTTDEGDLGGGVT